MLFPASRRIAFTPKWTRNILWRTARAVPSLDLPFADTKSLVDAVTGQSLVTFTRASSGRYVGSDGVLQTATTNLLLQSESFASTDSTALSNLTVTTNTIAAPNGTITADSIAGSSNTNNLKYWYKANNATTTGAYTASVYLKVGTQSIVAIRINDNTGVNGAIQSINLATGTLSGSVAVQGTATGASASISSIGDGWHRCSITCTFNSAITSLQGPAVFHDGYTTSTSTNTYYAWGAQLEQSSTVGEYIPTTSTINSAPRFDHAITSSVTNLLLRSEEFDNAYWTKNNSCTITQNDTTAPNGTLTADRFNGAALSFTGVYVFPTTISGLVYTFSVYVKNLSGATSLRLGIESNPVNAFVTFNAATGVISSQGANVTSSSVQATGDGWYRVAVTYTATGSSVGVVIYSTSGLVATWYTWGAQLEQSSTVGEYVQTTSAPAAANKTESLGLLVEEQRTNSIRNNTMVGAVAGTPGTFPTNWSIGGNSGLTYSVIGTGTDNGIQYIDIRFNGTTAAVAVPEATIGFEPSTAVAAVQNQTWTGSAYVKIVGGSLNGIIGGELFIIETSISGGLTGASSSIYSYSQLTGVLPNCRVSHTRTLTGATTAFVVNRVDINFIAGGGSVVDCTLRIGLPQLEQGAFATSVIPTTGAAATRSADVASITGANFSSWYRQDEGSVYWEGTRNRTTGFPERFNLNDGTANNRIFSYFDAAANSSTFTVVTSSVNQGDIFGGGGALNSNLKTGFGFASNNVSAIYSGGVQNTDTTVTLPIVNQLVIGNGLGGTIRRLVFFPQRLPNSTIQALTQ